MARRSTYTEQYYPPEIEYHVIWNVVQHHNAWIQCFCGIHLYRFFYIRKLGQSLTTYQEAIISWNGRNITHTDDGSYIWNPDFNISAYALDIIRDIYLGRTIYACEGYLSHYKDHVDVWEEVISDSGTDMYHTNYYDNIYDATIDQLIYCYGIEQIVTDGCSN